jgi:hypothetical protein
MSVTGFETSNDLTSPFAATPEDKAAVASRTEQLQL